MHSSSKKLLVILCIIAASAASIVLGAVTLTNQAPIISTVFRTGESAADKVTIYGNGFTFVSYEESVELSNVTHTVQFYLPSGALTDTLIVSGFNVAKITTSEEHHPIIERGDIITVFTEDAVYTGIFLGWDNMLLLEANNGTIMIPGSRIMRIILSEVVETQGSKILVEVTTDSPPGEYQLKISYLMRGPKWKPTYFVDVQTSILTCWATIENVEDWSDFTLVLVSGGPHVVYSGPIFQPYLDSIESIAFSTPSVDFSSTTEDEYHMYTYGAKLTFREGETVRLPLFNGTVDLRQEYFWSNGQVQNRYHINNTLDEPLAAGVIEFYRNETWVGEDNIPYTPVKGETVAVVNYAYDIKVSKQVVKSIDEYHHRVQGIETTIRNHKATSIQILIQQNIYGYTLV
ncbi:hypothetical protein KAS24_04750, partial [Candidatus Bathyarchaeota archaeon]|nr:hypothetical protein [Candidatus Bathyarchaeota archaeon]